MSCVRYCNSLAISVAVLLTTVPAQAEKNLAIVPSPRSDSAGWITRHDAFNARVKRGNVGLIFLGDSVVQGWEDSGKEAWNKFYGKRNAVNLGIGGDQAQHVLWRLDHGNIDGISPQVAVVMLGGDYGSGSTPEEIAAGMKAVVEKLRAKLPKTRVLMVGILPRGPNNDDPRRLVDTKANEIFSKLPDNEMVYYQDVSPAFRASDQTLNRDLMPDQFHLSDQGYLSLAEWLDDKVTTLMREMENPLLPVPLSSLDWWPPYHESLNARIKQGNVDLIFIGDSITNGWVNEGKEIWEKFYGKRHAVNLGISCDRIQNVLWRLDHGNIEGISPKLAVVMIGSNNTSDWKLDQKRLEEIPQGIKAIVERLRTKLPTTKVLLLGIFPRGPNNEYPLRKLNKEVNTSIAKFADGKTVFYLDIGSKLVAADGTASKEVLRDLVHLSPKGYAIWAEAIEPMVAELMGEK